MDKQKYLLDTNTCVSFLRNKHGVKEHIKTVGYHNCGISEITIAELLYGAECSSSPALNILLIEEFVKTIEVYPIKDTLQVYAQEKYKLRKKGLIIEDFDLLIGCTAISNSLILVTDNIKHMNRLSVKIENWIERDKG